jgi:hypothetical protein
MANTVASLIRTVRELTFDRFLVPSISFKSWAGFTVSVTTTQIIFSNGTDPDKIYTLSSFLTIQDLLDQFINDGIIFSYGPYYSGNEPINLVPTRSAISLATADLVLMRRMFFSDTFYKIIMVDYYNYVLFKPESRYFNAPALTLADITDDLVDKLLYPNDQHLCLWVAYKAVDKRRLYELAEEHLGQSFSDGSEYIAPDDGGNYGSLTMQLGDVFTLTEQNQDLFFSEQFNAVGSDNVLGDKFSFWYRLQLYFRDKLEQLFGDYSLRPDTLIQGTTQLERVYDWRSYFDSFPFTLSPFTRSII